MNSKGGPWLAPVAITWSVLSIDEFDGAMYAIGC
jgi:hypothetical protein